MNDNTRVFNMDCMKGMKEFPDKYFDLAIVDPPYGIGLSGTIGRATKKTKGFNFTSKKYDEKNWDAGIPDSEYFTELFRVSQDQIIWGANYFIDSLPDLKTVIYWYKKGLSVDDKFSDGELAYTSKGIGKMFNYWWNGFGCINSGEERFHPTQKPVALYKWLLKNYAKEGDKILDTHGGSMSSVIACLEMGFEITCYEKDPDYYLAAKKRIEQYLAQGNLFKEKGNVIFG